MPHPLLIFSQSNYLIQVVDTNSHNDKHCRSRSFFPDNLANFLHRRQTRPLLFILYKSRDTAFPTRLHVHPVKAQISLFIPTVQSESLQGIIWVTKNPKCCQADSKDSDQPLQMHRLIWVFAEHKCTLLWNNVPRLIFICSLDPIKESAGALYVLWLMGPVFQSKTFA